MTEERLKRLEKSAQWYADLKIFGAAAQYAEDVPELCAALREAWKRIEKLEQGTEIARMIAE